MPKPLPPERLPEDTIGQRIKKARLIKEWDIKTLSIESKAAETSISRYERDLMKPTISTFRKLTSALGVNIGWLAGYENLPEDNMPQKIKKYRLLNGWSRYDLADQANLDYSTIKKYENGEVVYPTEETVNKLEKALNIKIKSLK
ncbi:helix-turn-helix domain-containing protein [Halonatronum saccharophilum]|uniref:helix-turn-helix domain-containing protein n=1 Tax=Halonatronum saccharophilum TaxID=150060 RepID=UPI0004B92CE1|nr:helix-turn-helix transcriptional regulator [Halonatronum saccharophilum]